MSAWSFPTVLFIGSLALGACAAKQTPSTRLESTIDQLEVAARKERRKVRDLEYELARLEAVRRDDGRSAESAVHIDPDEAAIVPALRVEVLEPVDAAEPAPEAGERSDDDYHVVGVDEDGYEIVYVGDAARDRSVAPEISGLGGRDIRPAASRKSAGSASRGGATSTRSWTEPGERFQVTDDVGPTVERQLAQAREVRETNASRPRAAPRQVELPSVSDARDDKAKASERADEDDARAQYKRYYEALRLGNHAFAIAGFKNFIARHPGHGYADNARYWLAEAHYDRREYAVALDEFRKVERDYPDGNKVPDAMLKAGFCLIALGDTDGARKALEELIARHPTSKPAAMAKARLETLGGN